MSDVMKKFRVTIHEVADGLECFRFKCSKVMSFEKYIAQNQYLRGLITVVLFQRRRNRNDESAASFHSFSYRYHDGTHLDGSSQDVSVCCKDIISLHDDKKRRVQN